LCLANIALTKENPKMSKNSDGIMIPEKEPASATPLQIDASHLHPTLSAPNVGSVLPIQFYDGAAELFLDDSQIEMLRSFHDCPEEEIDVRPDGDGLIYVRHGWYERRLTEIFGPGAWAMVPATNVQIDRETGKIYVAWVLRARGSDGRTCFIGQAIGWALWQENNPRTNKADMFEITRSDAIVKICAKSSLMIGSNLWDRRFARAWVKKNCIRVRVRTHKGIEDWWRRTDEEPFTDEIREQKREPEPPAPTPPPTADKKPPVNHHATEIEPEIPEKEKPVATTKISDSQIRLFFAKARQKKIIVGADSSAATALVGSTLDRLPENVSGKTPDEILVMLLRSCSPLEFRKVLAALEAHNADA
jgi:hypothetical protein